MRIFFLLIFSLTLISFADTPSKKRISDAYFRYEFYTTYKKSTPKEDREYFWYKGGAIHKTESGIAGELLHGDFQKFYHSNQLAEAGLYKNGLKQGQWKNWHENGTLQSQQGWSDGQRDGRYSSYDKTGFLIETGNYRHGLKDGQWVNYISKDTLKYRRGLIRKDTPAATDTLGAKRGFFARLFGKKKAADITDTAKAPDTTASGKPGFFKRLFARKPKTEAAEGPKAKEKPNKMKKEAGAQKPPAKSKRKANAKST